MRNVATSPRAYKRPNFAAPAPEERSGRDGRAKRTNLTEAQRAYLDTLQSMVQINIDGDWDEDMIRVAFDRLRRT